MRFVIFAIGLSTTIFAAMPVAGSDDDELSFYNLLPEDSGRVCAIPSATSKLYAPLSRVSYDEEDDNAITEWNDAVERWRKQIAATGRMEIGSVRLVLSNYNARLRRLPIEITWDQEIRDNVWDPWISLPADEARSLNEQSRQGRITAEVAVGTRGERGQRDELIFVNPRLNIAGRSVPVANRILQEFVLKGREFEHYDGIYSVAISADGHRVLIGLNNSAILWNADNGKRLHHAFTGDGYGPHAAALSANGRRVLVGKVLWDAESGERLRTFARHGNCFAALSADGRLAFTFTSTDDHTAILWDANTGKQVHVFKGSDGRNYPMKWAALSADGHRLLGADEYGTAVLWNTEIGKSVRTILECRDRHDFSPDPPGAAALSSDGRIAVVGSNVSTATIWDTKTGTRLRVLSGKGRICCVAMTPDGRLIFTGTGGRSFVVALSPDRTSGGWIARDPYAGKEAEYDGDGTATLWDAHTGKQLLSFRAPAGRPKYVALSADGRRAVTGLGRHAAILWDAEF